VVLDQMKASIYLGHSVIFGFEVFQQIMSSQAAQTGVLTTPASTDNSIGGHDVSLVGWDDSTQMFKFRNHWMNGPGQPWGDNGYGYIPYAYATSANWVSDLWVINAVPGGVSPPTGISTLTLITPAAIGNYPFAAGNLSLGQILAAQAYTVAFAPGTGPNTLTLTLPVPAGVYALPGLGSLDLKQTLQAVTYSVVFTPAIMPPPPPPPPPPDPPRKRVGRPPTPDTRYSSRLQWISPWPRIISGVREVYPDWQKQPRTQRLSKQPKFKTLPSRRQPSTSPPRPWKFSRVFSSMGLDGILLDVIILA
jgi:hypothetical protein